MRITDEAQHNFNCSFDTKKKQMSEQSLGKGYFAIYSLHMGSKRRANSIKLGKTYNLETKNKDDKKDEKSSERCKKGMVLMKGRKGWIGWFMAFISDLKMTLVHETNTRREDVASRTNNSLKKDIMMHRRSGGV